MKSKNAKARSKANHRRLIEVCSECLRASCCQGILMCSNSRYASTTHKTVYELNKFKLESSSYWSAKHMIDVYGTKAPFGYSKELTTSAKE